MNSTVYINHDPGLKALNDMGRGHWYWLDYKDGHQYYEGVYKTHVFQVDIRADQASIYINQPTLNAKRELPIPSQWRKQKILAIIKAALARRLLNESTGTSA